MWKRHQSETDMTSETSRHTPWRPFEEAKAKAKVHAKAPKQRSVHRGAATPSLHRRCPAEEVQRCLMLVLMHVCMSAWTCMVASLQINREG